MKLAKPPGHVMVWSDLLHEGPVTDSADMDGYYHARARFLSRATGGGLRRDRLENRLRRQDQRLDQAADYHEVIFWHDACLYDMCHLMRHLHWLATTPPPNTAASLLCIDRYPGVDDFHGLGQIPPAGFLKLLPYRQPLTEDRIAAGSQAWCAFRAADPLGLPDAVTACERLLPAVSQALRRHQQQYPWSTDGLSLSERRLLQAVADGAAAPGAAFRQSQAEEARPFLGDTTCFLYLNRLLSGPSPALQTANHELLPTWKPPRDLSPWQLRLTDYGRALLAGDADWVADVGVDRWLGGVHLQGRRVWRWHETDGRLKLSR